MPYDKKIIFEAFPKQQEFIEAALSGKYSFITYGGAIRGGKTYALLALFLLLCRVFPGSRWAIVRKDLPTLKQNLLPSWNKIKPDDFIKSYNQSTQIVTFKNGSQIIFFPESYTTDKDLDRWKGLEVNGFGFEEVNECREQTLFKAFERAGSYVIKGAKHQPRPIVVATCNPTQGWFKQLVYEPWKTGTLRPSWIYIQSRIYDNIPLLTEQPNYLPNLKENLNHYEYEVFVEGNWDVQLQSGNEYLSDFNTARHLKTIAADETLPYHISLDSNVFPYIAITVYQLIKQDKGYIVRLVDELPVKPPGTNASKAAQYIIDYLNKKKNKERVHLYGDFSLKNSNTIDDLGRSFYKIVEEKIKAAGYLISDKMLPHASPSSIGDFINAIFRNEVKGINIEIGEHCKATINDFIETKKDKNGNPLKEEVSGVANMPKHQKNGHLVDTFKDFIVQAFREEYKAYLNRHSNLILGGISQPGALRKKVTF